MVKNYQTYRTSIGILLSAVLLLQACSSTQRPAAPCVGPSALVIRGGTVFAGDDLVPMPDATIVVREGKIIAVFGSGDAPAYDACAQVHDFAGSWVLPGLWDMHFHVSKVGSSVLKNLPSLGITGVRDMGSSIAEIQELRRRAAAGLELLPHLSSPGPMYEAAVSNGNREAQRTLEPKGETRRAIPSNPDELESDLLELRRAGADFVKLRTAAGREETLQFLGVTSRLALPVAMHPPSGVSPSELPGLGIVSIEHASYPYPIVGGKTPLDEITHGFIEAGTTIVPTIAAWRTQIADLDELRRQTDQALADPHRLRFIPLRLAVEWSFDLAQRKPRSPEGNRAWRSFYEQLITDLRALHAAGVPLAGGSDAGVEGVIPGLSLLDELCALEHEVGMTPMEVLRANTVGAAQIAGRASESGSISPGKSADFIILSQDPRNGIEALGSLQRTYLRGVAINGVTTPVCQ